MDTDRPFSVMNWKHNHDRSLWCKDTDICASKSNNFLYDRMRYNSWTKNKKTSIGVASLPRAPALHPAACRKTRIAGRLKPKTTLVYGVHFDDDGDVGRKQIDSE